MKWILIVSLFALIGCTSVQRQYVDNHPELSEQTRSDILARGIRVGMTKEQALVAFSGQHVWSRNNLNGTEVIVFGNPSYGMTHVFIRHDEVVRCYQTGM